MLYLSDTESSSFSDSAEPAGIRTDPVRILMFHGMVTSFSNIGPLSASHHAHFVSGGTEALTCLGHGESGQKFLYKTKALCQHIRTSILEQLQRDVIFVFADAPISSGRCSADSRAWSLGDYQKDRLSHLEGTVRYVIDILEEKGPFEGIIGFSTGASLSVIMASLLEDSRRCPEVLKLPVSHPPLRFVVAYSGFMLGHPAYRDIYSPKIRTPIAHFIGEVDPIIPNSLTLAVAKRCANTVVHSFWGSHYVPRSRVSFVQTSQFILAQLSHAEDVGTSSDDDWIWD